MSEIPDFTCDGIVFRCTVVDGRYEWVSADGYLRCGRDGGQCWARAGSRLLGDRFVNLRTAMLAAAAERRRAA